MVGDFLSVPHMVDIYAKNTDERGRNFLCKRKLPSLIDFPYIFHIDIISTTMQVLPPKQNIHEKTFARHMKICSRLLLRRRNFESLHELRSNS